MAATAPTALGVLAGGLGGVAAGLLDHALGAEGARQFLPDGSARLALYLAGLYGAAGALAVGLAALVLALLSRTTDLGPLWASAFSGHAVSLPDEHPPATSGPAARGRPLAAYALALAATLSLHGLWTWQATLLALRRFHSPLLIAALVGAEAAAMALPLALALLLLSALAGAVIRFGPRLPVRLSTPPAALSLGALCGLGLAAATTAELVLWLEQNRRMTVALRAANAGLWAPVLLASALVLGWLLARAVGPRLPGGLRRALGRPALVAGLPALLACLGVAALLAAAWPIARLLPLRAVGVAAAIPLSALLLSLSPAVRRQVARLPPPAQAAVALLLPPLLLTVALQAGRADRVRKAAAIHSSLSGPLLDGLHAAWDLDRDGYSPLLGSDCNDLDAEVHPGAFDWPDDGIDQNCNGHQATLARAPRPPFAPRPAGLPERPSVVLITVDALRWDHVGAYGYRRPTTPRIDELARESVRFENGWAHSPSTRYSVPAILIGRYESTIAWGSPQQHWPPQVLDDNRLMSEMFHEQGYHTAALTSARYFEPTWGLTQGFDEYDNSLAPLHGNIGGDPARATGSSSRQLADRGIGWVQEHAGPSEPPFFLWIHFYDPHYVHEPHPECAECSFGGAQPSEIDLYDGEVRFTDHHIGRLLDALRASGTWDRTVVFLSADHGEGFGEHGVKLHGYHIYSAQNRVPFLLRVPGLAPRVVAEPVGHVDLFPSLLNLMGRPDEPQLLGRSFLDLASGAAGPPRLVFQEVDFEGPTQRKAVASRTHQLIDNVIPDGTFEFYDLEHDPLEEHDRFERGAGGEQARLEAALGEWMDQSALPPDFAERVAKNVARAPLPSARALGADLGGLLVVDGVTAPEAVRAGEAAVVELVLHAPAPLPPGWRLFCHARSSAGGFLNLDHEPVEGFVPLARLRPGQWVRDKVRIAVPPAWRGATITVEVGLFRGRERAPVRRGGRAEGDALTVASLRVEP